MKLKEMIYKGLCNGIVRIIQNPHDDCIACEIGEYWFYFIGIEYEDLTPDEVYETFTKDELAEMILGAIKGLDETERDYYEAYLTEQLGLSKNENIEGMNGATKFVNWLLEMGYLDKEDISSDGVEIARDMNKVKEVAPKFYNMLMCMCDCEERA